VNADDLKKRTKRFALRILKLVSALPNTVQGRTVGGQLARAGTSVGANYRGAKRARSTVEFISKMGLVEEEADECCYWLDLLSESGRSPLQAIVPLRQEASELVAIAIASGLSNSAWAADEEDFERLVDQSLGASGPTLIGVRIDDKPGVGATRRDPVQIRERFMLGLGVREAL